MFCHMHCKMNHSQIHKMHRNVVQNLVQNLLNISGPSETSCMWMYLIPNSENIHTHTHKDWRRENIVRFDNPVLPLAALGKEWFWAEISKVAIGWSVIGKEVDKRNRRPEYVNGVVDFAWAKVWSTSVSVSLFLSPGPFTSTATCLINGGLAGDAMKPY